MFTGILVAPLFRKALKLWTLSYASDLSPEQVTCLPVPTVLQNRAIRFVKAIGNLVRLVVPICFIGHTQPCYTCQGGTVTQNAETSFLLCG